MVQHKVERVQIGKLVSLDLALAYSGEVLLHPLRCDLADENWVVLRLEGNQADVGVIALIAGTGMRDL